VHCFDELLSRGLDAFAELIARMDDAQYSCIHEESARSYFATSVASMCYRALLGQVRPWPCLQVAQHFFPREPRGEKKWYVLPRKKDEMVAWLEARKSQSLQQIQLAATQESLELLQRTEDFYGGESIRQEFIEGMQWWIKYLQFSKRPISVCSNWVLSSGRELPEGEPIFEAIQPHVLDDAEIMKAIGKRPFELPEHKTIAE
jgi:hypothetical protein